MTRLPIRVVRAGACAVVLALSIPVVAGAAGAPSGTYRVRTTATVRAPPVLEERLERDVDVTLSPDAGGVLRVRLESERYRCEMRARLSASGEIVLDPQQRCALAVSEPTARGRVEARLESGRGRVRGDRLEIDVSWALTGSIGLFVGGKTMEVLGREVEVPGTWMPGVPLRGTVRATGAGPRLNEPARR